MFRRGIWLATAVLLHLAVSDFRKLMATWTATVQQHNRYGNGIIIVWAGTTYDQSTELMIIQGYMTDQHYTDQILGPVPGCSICHTSWWKLQVAGRQFTSTPTKPVLPTSAFSPD